MITCERERKKERKKEAAHAYAVQFTTRFQLSGPSNELGTVMARRKVRVIYGIITIWFPVGRAGKKSVHQCTAAAER